MFGGFGENHEMSIEDPVEIGQSPMTDQDGEQFKGNVFDLTRPKDTINHFGMYQNQDGSEVYSQEQMTRMMNGATSKIPTCAQQMAFFKLQDFDNLSALLNTAWPLLPRSLFEGHSLVFEITLGSEPTNMHYNSWTFAGESRSKNMQYCSLSSERVPPAFVHPICQVCIVSKVNPMKKPVPCGASSHVFSNESDRTTVDGHAAIQTVESCSFQYNLHSGTDAYRIFFERPHEIVNKQPDFIDCVDRTHMYIKQEHPNTVIENRVMCTSWTRSERTDTLVMGAPYSIWILRHKVQILPHTLVSDVLANLKSLFDIRERLYNVNTPPVDCGGAPRTNKKRKGGDD